MGEIAEMMLGGEMCEQCGDWLGDGDGYPRLCSACEHDQKREDKVRCKHCGKKVKEVGLEQHMRDKHGTEVIRLRGER